MSPQEQLEHQDTTPGKRLLALARVRWSEKWQPDLGRALITLVIALCGSIAILTWGMTKAHAFTASPVEAQHCGVEGGCVLISKTRLQQEITRYAQEAYENGVKVGMNACRENS